MSSWTDTSSEHSSSLRSGRIEHGLSVDGALLVLGAAGAIAAALSGAEPVGVPWLDALWSALFSVAVVLAASRSRRLATTWMAGVAGVVGVGGDAIAVGFGLASLAGAGVTAFSSRRERILGAAIGLVASQAILRGDSYGFVGLPTLVAAVAVIPVFVSAWRIGRSRERRVVAWVGLSIAVFAVVGAVGAGVVAVQARPDIDAASDSAERALDLLHAGDTEAAATEFSRAEDGFEKASSALDGPLGVVGRALPVVAQQLEAVREVSTSGQALGSTASEAAATADWGRLAADTGTVDLEKVRAMQAPLAASADAIDAALATASDVRSPWLVAPLTDQLDVYEGRLLDAAEEARLAADGVTVAPALLGADGPRRYLVTFATPGESRNAGGFIGAYAIVDAVDGTLSVERTGRMSRDLRNPAAELALPQEWSEIYADYEVATHPGNASAGPDWPTDAVVAAELFAKSEGGTPVDGVIYADPTALAALLQLTGPVEVPGVPEALTAENAEQYLLIDQYVQYAGANADRVEVLGDVAQEVFEALTSQPLPGIRELTDVLGPAVAGGHLRVVSLGDQVERSFLRAASIDGAFTRTLGSDLISLRSANASESKIDVWLHRDVQVDASYDPTSGAVTSTVTVTLHNDAPEGGYPRYLLGNNFDLPNGTSRHMLSIYTPLTLSAVAIDGAAAGASGRQELGLNAYVVVRDIPPGEQVTITYELAGSIEPGLDYRLDLVPQPLANPDRVSVKVGRLGADVPPEPVFDGTLVEPTHLTVDVP